MDALIRAAIQTPTIAPMTLPTIEATPKPLAPHASGTNPPSVEPTARHIHRIRFSMVCLSATAIKTSTHSSVSCRRTGALLLRCESTRGSSAGVKIPAAIPYLSTVDADLAPSAERWTAQGLATRAHSHLVTVAAAPPGLLIYCATREGPP